MRVTIEATVSDLAVAVAHLLRAADELREQWDRPEHAADRDAVMNGYDTADPDSPVAKLFREHGALRRVCAAFEETRAPF